MFSITTLKKSLGHAWHGIKVTAREEHSFRVQIAVSILVFVGMWIFPISAGERGILALAGVFVLVLELLNSALERFVDVIKPVVHHYAKDIKDIMAGAVLVSSLGAGLIGVAILGPNILNLFLAVT